jgi:hypothetical protein
MGCAAFWRGHAGGPRNAALRARRPDPKLVRRAKKRQHVWGLHAENDIPAAYPATSENMTGGRHHPENT